MTASILVRPGETDVELGVYEKALAFTGSWDDFFASAVQGGFAFVDLSIDETPERLTRLDWTSTERAQVRSSADRHNVSLGGLCLSVHRKIAPGSADPQVRQAAMDVLYKSIDLCKDLGIPVLQLAGYYAFYEQPEPGARDRYVEVLRAGARYAAQRGILLGIENVDGDDIISISRAMEVVREINSAWLALYPDIGNLTERSVDVTAELAAGEGHMLALHVKETVPGQPRRIPMGEGAVPWDHAFAELARQHWTGRIMIEMWNDEHPESAHIAARARQFIADRLTEAGITVAPPVTAPTHPNW